MHSSHIRKSGTSSNFNKRQSSVWPACATHCPPSASTQHSMHVAAVALVSLVLCSVGTVALHAPLAQTRLLRQSRLKSVPVDITGRDITVDADIKSRIEFKVGKVLEKLGHDATSCHVTLKVLKNPEGEVHHSMKQDSHIGEVSVVLKGGAVVNVSDSSSDLETTVDLLVHTLSETLKKHKEKMVSRHNHKPSIGAITAIADDEE